MKRKLRDHLYFIMPVAIGLSALFTACSGKEDTSDKVEPTYSYLYKNVFSSEGDCSKCHNANGAKDNNIIQFNQAKATLYTALLNDQPKKNMYQAESCSEAKLVLAGDSSLSFLWGIASGDEEVRTVFNNKYGTCTINNVIHEGVTITSEQKQALKAWIDAGAPNN